MSNYYTSRTVQGLLSLLDKELTTMETGPFDQDNVAEIRAIYRALVASPEILKEVAEDE